MASGTELAHHKGPQRRQNKGQAGSQGLREHRQDTQPILKANAGSDLGQNRSPG